MDSLQKKREHTQERGIYHVWDKSLNVKNHKEHHSEHDPSQP